MEKYRNSGLGNVVIGLLLSCFLFSWATYYVLRDYSYNELIITFVFFFIDGSYRTSRKGILAASK